MSKKVLRFSLGASLALMFLLAGRVSCVFAGWIFALCLIFFANDKKANYLEIYLNGIIGYAGGLFWLWHTIEHLSGLNKLYVTAFFLLFVLTHALILPFFLLLFRSLPEFLDTLFLRTALAWGVVELTALQLFPWKIGHSQWSFTPFIQVADTGGVTLISFIVILCCELLLKSYDSANKKHSVFAAALIVAAVLYGVFRINQFSNHEKGAFDAALVQASGKVGHVTLRGDNSRIDKLKDLTKKIQDKTDLIIWPETSLPFKVHESVFKLANDPNLVRLNIRTNHLLGTKTFRRPNREFNSALFIEANGKIPLPYHKRLPIPFGEYTPAEKYLPFLKYVNSQTEGLSLGSESKIFNFKTATFNEEIKLAPFICYEEIFPDLAIESVNAGANVLVGISDDSWSGEAGWTTLYQHFTLSAFRSVETRRPLLLTSATGITASLNSAGQITGILNPEEDSVLRRSITPEEYRTIYTTIGGDLYLRYLAYFTVSISLLNYGLRKRWRKPD